MKSKTILPEEERIDQGKYNNFNYPLLVEKYHNALVAAEEEIEVLKQKLDFWEGNCCRVSDICREKDIKIDSLEKEVERLKLFIKTLQLGFN